jgi:hypothetical protein
MDLATRGQYQSGSKFARRYRAGCDPEWWRSCPSCGGKIAESHGKFNRSTCSTCCRPPQQRAEIFRRIERYAARAAARLPLFDEQPTEAVA